MAAQSAEVETTALRDARRTARRRRGRLLRRQRDLAGRDLPADAQLDAQVRDAEAALRDARYRELSWQAARSWAATDYLDVNPDSLDYTGPITMLPDVMRATIGLHLGVGYAPLRASPQLSCARCGAAVGPLLDHLHVCRVAGHGVTQTMRHDMWVAAWHEFMDATGQPTALEPRRQVARYAPGCKIPDILSARPGGRPTCLDVTIAHQTPPRLASFGSLDAFLRGAERRKRAEYADWMQLRQQQPRVIPLVGTTLGVIGLAARRFFEASCRAFEGGNAVASDALAVQNLGTQRQSVFWRRRISTQLRIAVATLVLARLGQADTSLGVEAPVAWRTESRRWTRAYHVQAERVGPGAVSAESEGYASVGGGFQRAVR